MVLVTELLSFDNRLNISKSDKQNNLIYKGYKEDGHE